MKAVRGGGVKRGDVCYGMLRAAACVTHTRWTSRTTTDLVVVYYCRTYVKAVRGRRVKRGDVRYHDGMLRAAACVDESDHHALMYVWHGQTVREDRVGEASARRP